MSSPFAPRFLRVVAVIYVCVAAMYTTNSLVSSVARLAVAHLPHEVVESSALLQYIGDQGNGLQATKTASDENARLFFSKKFTEKIRWEKMERRKTRLLSGISRGREPYPSTEAGFLVKGVCNVSGAPFLQRTE